MPAGAAGRFVLARCGAQDAHERAEQWSIYLRRPLFVAGQPRSGAGDLAYWPFCAPPSSAADPGYRWLGQLREGDWVNITGPYGNGFASAGAPQRVLLLATPDRWRLLAPVFDETLDRGGQVSLLLIDDQPPVVDVAALRSALPLSVELHTLGRSAWRQELAGSLRWADRLCAALPAEYMAPLADSIRQARLRLEAGFASALVDADFACGYGACLSCSVPLGNGSLTRACVHGPVFDLLDLAGRG